MLKCFFMSLMKNIEFSKSLLFFSLFQKNLTETKRKLCVHLDDSVSFFIFTSTIHSFIDLSLATQHSSEKYVRWWCNDDGNDDAMWKHTSHTFEYHVVFFLLYFLFVCNELVKNLILVITRSSLMLELFLLVRQKHEWIFDFFFLSFCFFVLKSNCFSFPCVFYGIIFFIW